MGFVHLHLMASHVPVMGILFLVPLLITALARRSDELARVGLWGLASIAGAGAFVYLTGEPTEQGIKSLAGISTAMLDQHEEIALISTILLGIAGVLALLALFRSRKTPVSRGIVIAALVSALGLSGVFAWTANYGGEIRHSEIMSATR